MNVYYAQIVFYLDYFIKRVFYLLKEGIYPGTLLNRGNHLIYKKSKLSSYP